MSAEAVGEVPGPPSASAVAPSAAARLPAPRLAITVFATARFDSRSWRMARSARRAGYDVVMYARWEPGLARDEVVDGVRVVRVPVPARQLVFGATSRIVLRVPRLPRLPRLGRGRRSNDSGVASSSGSAAAPTARPARPADETGEDADRPAGLGASIRRWLRFPHAIMPWAAALDRAVEPAEIWHGRNVGGVVAAVRQAKRQGGVAIYDSGDVYAQSRELASGRIYPRLVGRAERGWARRCGAVLTVNEPYADLLARQLRLPRPTIVMNCPERYEVPQRRPDLDSVPPSGSRRRPGSRSTRAA